MRCTLGRALAITATLAFASGALHAQISSPGRDSAGLLRGTHFEIGSRGALVRSVDSSLTIDAKIHATPRSFLMALGPGPDQGEAGPTRLTLAGLLPATVYYRYTDDFEHLDVVLTDDDGRHTFDLDLTAPRLVIVQPNPSTIHLKADGTGCPFIGTFDPATLTCRLRRDVLQTIEIDDDGVTLDGNGFTIDGTGPLAGSSGVLVGRRTGVAVRNLVIDGAPTGVIVSGASDSTFENITVRNGNGGFLEVFTTPSAGTGRNVFRNNNVTVTCDPLDAPCGFGFSGLLNNESTIEGNVVTGGQYGVTTAVSVLPVITDNTLVGCETGIAVLASLTAATISGNSVTGAGTGSGLVVNTAIGCAITGNLIDGAAVEAARLGSRECAVTDNTFMNSALGLNVLGALNTVVHNRFFDNTQQAEVSPDAADTLLSEEPRIGGNHWSDFNETAEGCVDLDANGYCDAPYLLTGGADLSPWAADRGWLDVTPPTTGIAIGGIAGLAGWFRSAVTATLSAEDEPGGTGVLRSEYSLDGAGFTSVDATVQVVDEGATDLYYRSIDRAGNAESPHTAAILIDATPPSVEAALAPPANPGGWNNSAVTVSFTCDDLHSGVASCPPSHVLSGAGADQEVAETASDVAGNTAGVTQNVSIDLAPPSIAFSGGCDTDALLNQMLSTDLTITDDLSGIAARSHPDGPAPLQTANVGPQSLPVTASDNAGNAAHAACDYAVIYDFLGAGGFRMPVDAPPVVNVARAGSAIPVKWKLPNGLGGYLSSLVVVRSIQAQQVSCSEFGNALADPIETTTAGASGLHFDAGAMQFVYNWKTTSLMGGKCFALLLNLSDDRTYRADFRFTR